MNGEEMKTTGQFMITKILAVLVLLFTTLACSPTPEELLLGKWETFIGKSETFSGQKVTHQFQRDGSYSATISQSHPHPPIHQSGKWSIDGDKRVSITIFINGKEAEPMSLVISFPDNETLVTALWSPEHGANNAMIYTRVSDPNKDALASGSEVNGTDSSNSDTPQDMIDGAINTVKSGHCSNIECTNFTVAFADSKNLGPSDKLNGISKRYQIGIDYAKKNQGKWIDGYGCLIATNPNGRWDFIATFPYPSLKEAKICTP